MRNMMQKLKLLVVATKAKAAHLYVNLVTGGLGFLYAGMAAAAASIDERKGPFMDVICPVSNWMAAIVVPLATIAFLVAGVMFLWGEELTGLTKKWITMIIAVATALGGSSIVAWISQKFGYTAVCY